LFYQVKANRSVYKCYIGEVSDDDFGECDREEKIIRINKEMNKGIRNIIKTLLHECGHVLFEENSWNQEERLEAFEQVISNEFSEFMDDNFNISLKKENKL